MFGNMNKNISVITLALILFASCVCGQSKYDWQKFTAADDSFSVLMPPKPKVNNRTDKSGKGKATIYSAISTDGLFDFGIEEITFDYDMDVYDRIEALRKNLLVRLDANLVSQEDIEVKGYQGTNMVLITEYRSIKGRILVSGRKAFMVLMGAPSFSETNEEQVDKFFSSFEILKTAGETQ